MKKTKQTEPAEISHPHDLLVRTVLADPDIAGDLFRNYPDPAIAETIDFDSLKREGADTVSSGLSKLVGDLRYSAKFKDSADKLDVFVFLEHQSQQAA